MSAELALDWSQSPQSFRDAHKAAVAERDALRREVVFLRVVGAKELNSPLGQVFERGFVGPVTEDAVRQEWDRLQVGLIERKLSASGGDLRRLVQR